MSNSTSQTGGEANGKAVAERIKFVVVGDGGTGKTSLLTVYTNGEFPTDYTPTVFENFTSETEFKGKKYALMLWDTAGQEDYDRLRPLSYDAVDVIIMCYDVASWSTFENLTTRWAPEMRHFCPEAPVVLVGCKTDLRETNEADAGNGDATQQCVSLSVSNLHKKKFIGSKEGEELADSIRASAFVECSAKNNENVSKVFNHAIELAFQQESSSSSDCNCCLVC